MEPIDLNASGLNRRHIFELQKCFDEQPKASDNNEVVLIKVQINLLSYIQRNYRETIADINKETPL